MRLDVSETPQKARLAVTKYKNTSKPELFEALENARSVLREYRKLHQRSEHLLGARKKMSDAESFAIALEDLIAVLPNYARAKEQYPIKIDDSKLVGENGTLIGSKGRPRNRK